MTVSEAAQIIGCSAKHVCALIRAGKLRARKIPGPYNKAGYRYEIAKRDAERYAAKPQAQGWPRGKPRNTKGAK